MVPGPAHGNHDLGSSQIVDLIVMGGNRRRHVPPHRILLRDPDAEGPLATPTPDLTYIDSLHDLEGNPPTT